MKENWQQVSSIGIIVLVSDRPQSESSCHPEMVSSVILNLELRYNSSSSPFPPISDLLPVLCRLLLPHLILDSLPAQRELVELPTKQLTKYLPPKVLASEETLQEVSAPCSLTTYPASSTFAQDLPG